MAHMVKCLECGATFEAQRKTAVFCSNLCRATYAQREPRIQKLAGELLVNIAAYRSRLRSDLKAGTRFDLEWMKSQVELLLKEAEQLREKE